MSIHDRLCELESAYGPQQQRGRRESLVSLVEGDAEGARLLKETAQFMYRVEDREPDLRGRRDTGFRELMQHMTDRERVAFGELARRLQQRLEFLRRQRANAPRWKAARR